jgi:hypothetical protein
MGESVACGCLEESQSCLAGVKLSHSIPQEHRLSIQRGIRLYCDQEPRLAMQHK